MTDLKRRTAKLRELISSPDLRFLLEAHNGISAKIAEEAGFEGLWASGLAISACCGVRDNNELSWTQVLEILELISDATTIPLLLDGDTGYGNFNNMRRLVKKLESRSVAGVCIEDKLFPKSNSFIDGDTQPLADMEEFAGKIKAGKDAQRSDDFCVVARVEAFIAGWGLAEALRRAEVYRAAGADAILIHSKRSTAEEVLAFKREWGDRSPVVIVPTKYYSTPTDVLRKAGFSVAIWANHMLRASVRAMQETAEQLRVGESLIDVEERVVSVAEVFRLQGADELKEAEKKYLPSKSATTKAVILAASRGSALGSLTEDKPKALLPIAGKPMLDHVLDTLNAVGIKEITVVRGYKKALLDRPNTRSVDNDRYESTQEVYSLFQGIKDLDGAIVVSYGDVMCHKYVFMHLLESEADFSIAVDPNWEQSQNIHRYGDFVTCDRAHVRHEFDRTATLSAMGSAHDAPGLGTVHGEWIGIMKVAASGLIALKDVLRDIEGEGGLETMRMVDLFNRLVAAGKRVEVIYSLGAWFDVDELKDLLAAGEFKGGPR